MSMKAPGENTVPETFVEVEVGPPNGESVIDCLKAALLERQRVNQNYSRLAGLDLNTVNSPQKGFASFGALFFIQVT